MQLDNYYIIAVARLTSYCNTLYILKNIMIDYDDLLNKPPFYVSDPMDDDV